MNHLPIVVPQSDVNSPTVTLVEWLLAEGAWVTAGEAVATVETSKAVMEVEAPGDGYVKRGAAVGEQVAVGAVIGWLSAEEVSRRQEDAPPAQVKATAKAQALARAHGIDLATLAVRGIITERHVQERIAQAGRGADLAGEPVVQAGRRVALDGVQLAAMRAVVAARESQAPAFLLGEVDVTDLLPALEAASQGVMGGVTLNDALIFHAARLLKDHFPRLNASLEGESVVERAAVNVGSTAEVDGRLYMTVIHQADTLSLAEIANRRTFNILQLMRGDPPGDILAGGTFSVSVLKEPSLTHLVPIIYPGQAAILGLAGVRRCFRPGAAGEPLLRLVAGISLTYDHRFVNGAMASAFVEAMAGRLAGGER